MAATTKEHVKQAVAAIAAVSQVSMPPMRLAQDAFLLAQAFTQEADYLVAVASTCRALDQLAAGVVATAGLQYNLAGWQSYHFQHKVAQGQRADMRIVFKRIEGGIAVLAFGHRNLPIDFYLRLRELELK